MKWVDEIMRGENTIKKRPVIDNASLTYQFNEMIPILGAMTNRMRANEVLLALHRVFVPNRKERRSNNKIYRISR